MAYMRMDADISAELSSAHERSTEADRTTYEHRYLSLSEARLIPCIRDWNVTNHNMDSSWGDNFKARFKALTKACKRNLLPSRDPSSPCLEKNAFISPTTWEDISYGVAGHFHLYVNSQKDIVQRYASSEDLPRVHLDSLPNKCWRLHYIIVT